MSSAARLRSTPASPRTATGAGWASSGNWPTAEPKPSGLVGPSPRSTSTTTSAPTPASAAPPTSGCSTTSRKVAGTRSSSGTSTACTADRSSSRNCPDLRPRPESPTSHRARRLRPGHRRRDAGGPDAGRRRRQRERQQAATRATQDAGDRRVRAPHMGGGTRPFGFQDDRITHDPDEAAGDPRHSPTVPWPAKASPSLGRWLARQRHHAPSPASRGGPRRSARLLLNPRIYGVRVHRGPAHRPGRLGADHHRRARRGPARPAHRPRRDDQPNRPPLPALGMCRCGLCGTVDVLGARYEERRYLCRSGHDFGGCGSMAITADPPSGSSPRCRPASDSTARTCTTPWPDASATTQAPAHSRDQIAADTTQLEELAELYADRRDHRTGMDRAPASTIEARRDRSATTTQPPIRHARPRRLHRQRQRAARAVGRPQPRPAARHRQGPDRPRRDPPRRHGSPRRRRRARPPGLAPLSRPAPAPCSRSALARAPGTRPTQQHHHPFDRARIRHLHRHPLLRTGLLHQRPNLVRPSSPAHDHCTHTAGGPCQPSCSSESHDCSGSAPPSSSDASSSTSSSDRPHDLHPLRLEALRHVVPMPPGTR